MKIVHLRTLDNTETLSAIGLKNDTDEDNSSKYIQYENTFRTLKYK